MKRIYLILTVLAIALSCTKTAAPKLDLDKDTSLLGLKLDKFEAEIDCRKGTAKVEVPQGYDLSSMTIEELTVPEGAVADLNCGDVLNMLVPHKLTVRNGDAYMDYTISASVHIEPIEGAKVIYAGLADEIRGLNPEERAAAQWLVDNVEGAAYASFKGIASGAVNLEECELVWWHLHKDGGIDNMDKFAAAAPGALSALPVLKAYYYAGGNFLLTRFATFYAAKLGATETVPNNCWGGAEANPETVGGPWSFSVQGHDSHPLYAGLVRPEGESQDKVYTFDTGYRTTNSTAQWHIGTDWGGYPNLDSWRAATGASDLGYGGDGAVVVWEFPASASHGGILCIGSGCYDWYADGYDASSDSFHGNIARMTLNAIEYLNK